ncbi:MAG: hypothetical protein WC501_03440 [Candidatus Micrarchaeia archaeon]
MVSYKDWKSKKDVEIKDAQNFEFPSTGAKILLKSRPPVSKFCSTD